MKNNDFDYTLTGFDNIVEQLEKWADSFLSVFGDPYEELRKAIDDITILENKTPKEYGRYLIEKKYKKIHPCKTYNAERKVKKHLPYQRRNY